jgi:hypothetical protein
MASSYSSLKIELIGTGEQAGTWGTTTNNNFQFAVEEAITGSADVPFTTGDVTLTLTNTNASQTARNLRLRLTGTPGVARNLIVPGIEKQYIVRNDTDATITIKNATGTGVAIPVGTSAIVYNNTANITSASIFSTDGAFANPLPVTSGGTGFASYTIGDIVYASTTTAFSKLADVATGNALISGGVATAPSWGKIGLVTHVSGILPAANGGTNNGFFSVSGPNTSVKTYTFPDATCSVLTSNDTVTVAQGGTGVSTIGAAETTLVSNGTTLSFQYSRVAQNAQNGNITLALTDSSKHIYSKNTGAQTITVPTNASVAFPIGTAITIVNNGTTAITFTTTSLTVYKAGTSTAWASGGTLAVRGLVTLLKVETDTWFISGAGLS